MGRCQNGSAESPFPPSLSLLQNTYQGGLAMPAWNNRPMTITFDYVNSPQPAVANVRCVDNCFDSK